MVTAGSMCEVHGLQSRADLNGHLALVLSYCQERQRFAVEDVRSGERVMVKEANLRTRDTVGQLLKGGLGDIDECHKFTPKLFRLACPGVTPHKVQWPKQLFSALEEVSDHSLVLLDLNAIGHMCALEVVRTPGGLRGRLLQSWVKNSGGSRTQCGFSAREWLQREESGGWMEEEQLKGWCSGLMELRRLIQALTEDELLNCARAKGKHDAAAQRAWAGDLVAGVGSRALTQQPGGLEDVDAYKQSMEASGYPAHVVIYAGLGSRSGPEQVLDFPLQLGLPIMRLGRELFGVDLSAFTWLRAIEFHGHPTAWQLATGRIVSK